ncbi:MAG: type II toxin-antitoxin system Phd/YefM family antitoxin [Deltaproteobacteria bacterium]|nr:type II toxin-antitoxin system Phd/YefM family antitoxin [Deltaproteobacteria bacterium]
MVRRSTATVREVSAPKRVTIGRLRDQLSAHLALVREGGEVVVLDRTVPIARLVPYESVESADGLDDLVARGLITRPTETADWAAFDRMPAPRLKGNELLEAVLADRDED